MLFAYSRVSEIGGEATIETVYRAAEAVHVFCGVTDPLLLLDRQQRVYVNSNCIARPAFPLFGSGHTYRTLTGTSDLDITVDVRSNGALLEFPSTYAESVLLVSGIAGYGWHDDVFEFPDAARTATTLVSSAAERVAIGMASYQITGSPRLPDAAEGRQIIVTVGTESHTFDLADLREKPALASVGPALSDANAITWTAGGVEYLIARRDNGEFLFSADTVGDYSITIVDSAIDTSTLTALSAAATTISDADGFAGVEPGDVLKIDDELMIVSAKGTSPAFTVVRGIAGTTAVAHAAGSEVRRLRPPFMLSDGAAKVGEGILARKRVPTSGAGRPQFRDGKKQTVQIDIYAGANDDLRQFVALGRPF